MKKAFGIPIALIGIAAIAKYFKDTGFDFIKMKTASGYLQLLRGLRALLISTFEFAFFSLFLIASILMIEIAVTFLFASTPKTQMIIMLSFGAANTAVAIGVLYLLFSSRRWLDMAVKTNKTLAKMRKKGQL